MGPPGQGINQSKLGSSALTQQEVGEENCRFPPEAQGGSASLGMRELRQQKPPSPAT